MKEATRYEPALEEIAGRTAAHSISNTAGHALNEIELARGGSRRGSPDACVEHDINSTCHLASIAE